HEKEYIVTVNKAIDEDFVQKMSNGVQILGTTTQACFVRQEGNRKFRITLTQGLNRQIRRMCETLGYKVMTLNRVRIMNINLEGLPLGKWRYLHPHEVDDMQKLVAQSSKISIRKSRTQPDEKHKETPSKPKTKIREPRPKATKKDHSFKAYRNQRKR